MINQEILRPIQIHSSDKTLASIERFHITKLWHLGNIALLRVEIIGSPTCSVRYNEDHFSLQHFKAFLPLTTEDKVLTQNGRFFQTTSIREQKLNMKLTRRDFAKLLGVGGTALSIASMVSDAQAQTPEPKSIHTWLDSDKKQIYAYDLELR